MKKLIIKCGTAIWLLFVIGFCLWLTNGDIFSVILSFGSEILKILGCFLLFFIICLIFPKSWFAKIFKDKL